MYVLYIVLILPVIAISPFLFIWSINTLFLIGIDYTFKTWLAMALLVGVVGGASRGNK